MSAPLLAHHSTGNGTPVLLLNGGLMTMMAWEPVAAPLAAGHRVVRCDFRGQFLSPGTPPPTPDGHADDVIAVLDALGIDRAHVVGTSFGAMVGVVLAARRPNRVRSLVAATATDRFTAEDWQRGQVVLEACRAAAEGTGDGGRVLDLLHPATFTPSYLQANRAVLQARRNAVSGLPRAYFAAMHGLLSLLERLDLRADASAVRCPTLVLAGAEDVTFPVERSQALAALIPGATLHVVPRVGHGLVVEDPVAALDAIRGFLARVEASGA